MKYSETPEGFMPYPGEGEEVVREAPMTKEGKLNALFAAVASLHAYAYWKDPSHRAIIYKQAEALRKIAREIRRGLP